MPPESAEGLEEEGLEFDDGLLGAEDTGEDTPVGDEVASQPAAESATSTPEPSWKQAGFSTVDDYVRHLQEDRDAKIEGLRKYEEDKNIQAYTARLERQQQAEESQRVKAFQARDKRFMEFAENTGLPAGITQGFRHLLDEERKEEREAHGAVLRQVIDHFQGQLQEATVPLKHIMDAVSIKQAPEPIQKASDEAQVFLELARRAGFNETEAKALVGRNMLSAHEKWVGVKAAAQTGNKPNLQVARKPGMESMDTGGGEPKDTESFGKVSKAFWDAQYK